MSLGQHCCRSEQVNEVVPVPLLEPLAPVLPLLPVLLPVVSPELPPLPPPVLLPPQPMSKARPDRVIQFAVIPFVSLLAARTYKIVQRPSSLDVVDESMHCSSVQPMNALRSRTHSRAVVIDAHRHEVEDGPDRGPYVVLRDGSHWAFVRRGDERQWIGNTVDGWSELALGVRIMAEAR